MTHVAKNLAAICEAIDHHNANCQVGQAMEVRLSHHEYDRLGWDEVKGIPIRPDSMLGSGRFRIVCAGASSGSESHELAVAV